MVELRGTPSTRPLYVLRPHLTLHWPTRGDLLSQSPWWTNFLLVRSADFSLMWISGHKGVSQYQCCKATDCQSGGNGWYGAFLVVRKCSLMEAYLSIAVCSPYWSNSGMAATSSKRQGVEGILKSIR